MWKSQTKEQSHKTTMTTTIEKIYVLHAFVCRRINSLVLLDFVTTENEERTPKRPKPTTTCKTPKAEAIALNTVCVGFTKNKYIEQCKQLGSIHIFIQLLHAADTAAGKRMKITATRYEMVTNNGFCKWNRIQLTSTNTMTKSKSLKTSESRADLKLRNW